MADVTTYENCLVEVVCFDGRPADEMERNDVRIGNGEVVISCATDDGERRVWQGELREDGHHVLECPQIGGKSTLHRFPGSRILEGYWAERDEGGTLDRGFWRVHLLG